MAPARTPEQHGDVASVLAGEGKEGLAECERYQAGKARCGLVKRGELV